MAALAVRVRISSLPRLAFSRWGAVFALTGLAGIALRVWTYRSELGVPNSDEAVMGLMARHLLHGELTTFYWGQAYGGSQEVLLTGPGFLIFGSSWVALRVVPIVLSAVAALLVWRVGRRTIGEPAAAVAAGLYWIWPPYLILQLTHQQGFYASNVVYCGLLLLLALRIVERPDRVRVGLFGLVLGLAFWQSGQIVPIAVPVIAWTVWRQPRCLRHLWVAAGLAVLGALPWLVWNASHDWASLDLPYGDKSYEHRLRVFVSPIMPMTLGLRIPFSYERLLPALLTFLIYGLLVAAFAYGAYRTRRRNASLLYVVAAVFPFLYAISPQTLNSREPRYVIVLTPVLALLLAQVATTYARAVALLAVVGTISAVTLHKMDTYFRTAGTEVPMAPRDLGPLISKLDEAGIDHVYANYWLAYRLAFDTRERIVSTPAKFAELTFGSGHANLAPNPYVRYPPYEHEVDADPRHGFVFFRRTIGEYPIVAQLEQHGYRRSVVGPFVVFEPGASG